MNSDNYRVNVELFLENRRDALLRIIENLNERLNGITFDEEGNIIGELDKKLSDISFDEKGKPIGNIESSVYFLNANRSADDLRLIILNSDIEKQRNEIKQIEEKQKNEKLFLEEQKKLLAEKDEEIYKLDIKILTSDRNDPKSFVETTEELILQRTKREELSKLIERLSAEIKTSNRLNRASIKINKELIKSLTKKFDAIKEKTVRDYIDYEKLKLDMTELDNAKKVLEKIEQSQKVFNPDEIEDKLAETENKSKDTNVTVEDKTQEEKQDKPTEEEVPNTDTSKPEEVPNTDTKKSEEVPNTDIPKPDEIPNTDTSKPEDIPNTDLPKPDEIPIKDTSKPEEVDRSVPLKSNNKEWKMDGFRLDFIEKFKYIPDEEDRRINANYNGDFNLLRTNYGAPNPYANAGIVTRIRNAVSGFADSVRNFPSKIFVKRNAEEIDISKLATPTVVK